MTWVARLVLLPLFFLSPAFADNIVDIVGNNIAMPGSVMLNFSFAFDSTTDTVVGNSTFTATGSQQFVTALNLSQLAFQSAVTNSAGFTSINFSGPADPGGTTYISLGPNGLQVPPNPADYPFPSVGIYDGSIVLVDAGYLGYAGTVTVTDPPSVPVPEPSVTFLLLSGLLVVITAKAFHARSSASLNS